MSITQIEDMFRSIVCRLLGVDADDGGRVRFVWGSDVDRNSKSAPNLATTQDVCYIQITPQDDNFNRLRTIRYIDMGGVDLTAIDEHTDVHSVLFINYGTNAYDNARRIRNGLYSNDVRRTLRLNNFALVTDAPAIRRVPEIVNANWINRVDVSATFNQFVRLVGVMETIERVGVDIVQESGRAHSFETEVFLPQKARQKPPNTSVQESRTGARLTERK